MPNLVVSAVIYIKKILITKPHPYLSSIFRLKKDKDEVWCSNVLIEER